MYSVSEKYLNYINDNSIIGRNSKNKVVIDNVEYLSDTLKSNPKISHKAASFIGGFPAKTCEFEILNIDGSLSLNNKEIEVYKGLEIDGSIEWVKMGLFKAKDEDITTNETTKSISFKGTDRAVLFDAVYTSSLEWETAHTGLEIVQEVCSIVGITLETTDFNFASYSFTQKPNFNENSTYREVISRIAEIGGEIAYISRDGGLRIAGQNITNQTAGKSKREKLTKEQPFVINTVVLGKKDIDDNIYYSADEEIENVVEWKILDNPYVDLIRESIIEEVASHIIGMSIVPYSMTNFIDDYIYDLNDVIQVTDNYGNTFNAVVLEYETSSRIKSNISASTQTEEKTDYKIAGSMKQDISRVKLQVDHNEQEISALATKTEEKIEEAKNEVITSTTTMIQNSEATTFTALKEYVRTEELDTYKDTVSTQFKQTSEDFTMQFNTASGRIDELSNETSEQFQEIQKYIRFVDGNIVLGEAGNELTLKIQNNRISFLQSDLEVAYFSDNKLYVKDGEFINSLQLGNFAFLPRTNKNLSFKKVGDN